MKSFAIIRRKNPALKKCPSCFSEGFDYRSHSRNWKEKLIKRITCFRIYKCKKCGWRGYRSTVEFTLKSIQNLLTVYRNCNNYSFNCKDYPGQACHLISFSLNFFSKKCFR